MGQFLEKSGIKSEKIEFPTNFRELCILDSGFPGKFCFSSLEKCRQNITKLCLETDSKLVEEDWNFLINGSFPALKELSINSPIRNAEILAKLCFENPWLETLKIRVEYEKLKASDLLPIRSLQELKEFRLDLARLNQSGAHLDSNFAAAVLNENLRKVSFEAKDAEESVLLKISGICGLNLEYFSLRTGRPSKFKGKFWGEFVAQCPNLSELRIYQLEIPKIRQIAANLPNEFEILLVDFRRKSRAKIVKWIEELCEERIKLNRTAKILTLDISKGQRSDFYEQLNEILEQANVDLVKNAVYFEWFWERVAPEA